MVSQGSASSDKRNGGPWPPAPVLLSEELQPWLKMANWMKTNKKKHNTRQKHTTHAPDYSIPCSAHIFLLRAWAHELHHSFHRAWIRKHLLVALLDRFLWKVNFEKYIVFQLLPLDYSAQWPMFQSGKGPPQSVSRRQHKINKFGLKWNSVHAVGTALAVRY